MDLELAVGVLIAVGLVGIVAPVLPGLLLVWAAVLVWALDERTTLAWWVAGGATLVLVASAVVKYYVPGRRLQSAGVPNRSLLAGAVLAVPGFFVVPVVGLFLGFVLGVYLAELARHRSVRPALRSSVHALRAVVLSSAIELAAGVLIATAWAVAAVTT